MARTENRVKKTNHISNLYPNIKHLPHPEGEHTPRCCSTGKDPLFTQGNETSDCNSCGKRAKRK
jgi:hypothetical protein